MGFILGTTNPLTIGIFAENQWATKYKSSIEILYINSYCFTYSSNASPTIKSIIGAGIGLSESEQNII